MRKLKIGRGVFYTGDCFEAMAKLPPASVDLILCDLPYGMTKIKWDCALNLEELWVHYWMLLKKSSPVLLTSSQPFTTTLISSQLVQFRYEWIWAKDRPSNFALANRQPLKEHESVCVFYRAQPTYNKQPQPRKGSGAARCATAVDNGNQKSAHVTLSAPSKMYDPHNRNPSSVQEFSCGQRQQSWHPTQKPVALFEYLIRTYTNEGDTVLDNCAGSGTTAIAAENAGRSWICIEKDKEYAARAIERVKTHCAAMRRKS